MIQVKNTVKKFFMYSFILLTAVMFLLRNESAAEGVTSSLKLCASTVVPSLLPFMVLSSYIIKSDMISSLGKVFERPCRRLFRLPGEAACIIIMSMTGGFPVGAKMISSALENGTLTKKQSKRMMLFCVNAGPAFVVNAVGVSMLGSRKAGAVLLAATLSASLLIGIVSRFLADGEKINRKPKSAIGKGEALTASVEGAVEAMLTVCGWILVFGAVRQIIYDAGVPENFRRIADLVCEVTNGCAASVNLFPLPVTAFVLGFSGFAVHAQLLPFINETGLEYKAFFAARALNGAVSAALAELLFKLFPCTVQVFGSEIQATPVAFSASAYASVAAIFTAALIILDLAPGRKI